MYVGRWGFFAAARLERPGWLNGRTLLATANPGLLVAMGIYASEPGRSGLEMAATLDPGNYRVRLAAARSYGGGEDGRCRHARAARDLYPSARAARRLADRCD